MSYRVDVRQRLVLAVLIAALTGLVIGILFTSNSGITCEDWQDEYVRVAEQGSGGVFASINQGPTADRLRELEQGRPDDCATPEV